jgi:L-2-hydroxyglutarate oxidase LhgO
MAGIRPKLQGPNDDFCDFVIKEDAPGFINLVGIESPGLTASPAIARLVKEML